ncbi:MAG: hypothetical protein H6678_11285 [Candidatus Delongbacteria bacterium]|nr:hypothetical protein [Candidatus Cloacimonadota bacterium]MCB9474384.1 hypothetical protein [Candidatus Delongbacteria bacterium]
MSDTPTKEQLQQIHRGFAAQCFNACWDLIDKHDRSAQDDETMRRLAEVSLWHWTQVTDHTALQMSVGYWQLSRVYAISGLCERALDYAEHCMAVSSAAELAAFYRAYAWEARARALATCGQHEEAASAIRNARDLAAEVEDAESRAMLEKDLDSISA